MKASLECVRPRVQCSVLQGKRKKEKEENQIPSKIANQQRGGHGQLEVLYWKFFQEHILFLCFCFYFIVFITERAKGAERSLLHMFLILLHYTILSSNSELMRVWNHRGRLSCHFMALFPLQLFSFYSRIILSPKYYKPFHTSFK